MMQGSETTDYYIMIKAKFSRIYQVTSSGQSGDRSARRNKIHNTHASHFTRHRRTHSTIKGRSRKGRERERRVKREKRERKKREKKERKKKDNEREREKRCRRGIIYKSLYTEGTFKSQRFMGLKRLECQASKNNLLLNKNNCSLSITGRFPVNGVSFLDRVFRNSRFLWIAEAKG